MKSIPFPNGIVSILLNGEKNVKIKSDGIELNSNDDTTNKKI